MNSYVQRLLTYTIQLGQGSFGGSGFDTVTLQGLRSVARFEQAVNTSFGVGGNQAIIRIYGLTLSQMNQLSKCGLLWNSRLNLISVQAGDAQSGMTTIFNGQINEAYPSFVEGPNAAFMISATIRQDIALKPVTPTSYPGSADVGTVMGSLAQQAGLTLENNGVDVKLASPYFPGTMMEQIIRCAKAANIYAYVDGPSSTLAIWPKSGARSGVTMISPSTGTISYPAFQQSLIKVRTLFTPSLKLGTQIQVQSQLSAANGLWNIIRLDYDLSSLLPDGPWEATILGVSQAQAANLP